MPLLAKLPPKLELNRIRLMEWAVVAGWDTLELKWKTVELAMRMFDYYLYLFEAEKEKTKSSKGQKAKKVPHLLDNLDACKLTMITILFSCSKYNEIYPPCLSDFSYVCNDKYGRTEILFKEVEIIEKTNCAYAMTTVEHWYGYLYLAKMPAWGYETYIRAYYKHPEVIARAIWEVEQTAPSSEGSTEKLMRAYLLLNLSKEHPTIADKLSKQA
jgi:hypothetical protein